MSPNPDLNPVPTPPKDPPQAPRKRRRFLKAFLIVLGLFVALLAAAPTLIGRFARGRIETVAREALEADVSIGDLSLGWTSGISVDDIAVKPRAEGKPGFSVGSITAKPTLSALLKGRVEVPDLVIKHVTVDLTASSKEEKEEEEETEAEEEAKPIQTVPDFGLHATIEDVTVVFRDPAWPAPVRVDHLGPVVISATNQDATHIDLTGGAGLKGSIDLQWAKDGKKLRRRERRISGAITFDHTDLASFKGAAAPWVEALQGVVNGAIKFEQVGKAMTSSGSLRIERASVAMRGAPDAHVLNDVTLSHDVSRDAASAWTGQVELGAAKGRIAPISALGQPLAIERLDLKARLSGNIRVAVERLNLAADFGSIEGRGIVAAGKEPRSANAEIQAKASLTQLAPWVGGLPDVTGTLTSNAKIVLEESGLITVRGTTKLADFAAKDVKGVGAVREKEIVLKHDLDWGSEVVRMHDVALTSSFATARCTGSLQPKSGGAAPEGAIDLQLSANLDVISGLLGDNLAIKPTGRLTAGGKIVAATADGMSFDLKLDGDKVVLAGGPFTEAPLDLGNLQGAASGKLASDRSRLDVSGWTLRARPLNASGKATAERLKDAHPGVRASFTATAMPDVVLPSLTKTQPLQKIGNVSLNADVIGDDKAWTVNVAKLSANGLEADGSVAFPHADVPSGAPQFKGKVAAVLETLIPLLSETTKASGKLTANLSGGLGIRPVVNANVQGDNLRFQTAEGATMAGNLNVVATTEETKRFNVSLASPVLTFTDKNKKSVSGPVALALSGTYDQETGVGQIGSVTGSGPGATITGSAGFVPGKEASFDLKADLTMAQAAPLLAFFAPTLEASGTGAMTAKGRISLKEGGGARDSTANVDLRLDGLKTEGLDLKNVDVKATLGGGIAKVDKATANLNGGTARLDANVDFRSEVPGWKGNFNLDKVQITKEMQPAIARAIPIFAGIAVTVTGVMGAVIDVSGRGDDWEAVKPTLTGTGVISSTGTRLSKGEILDAVGKFIGLPNDLQFEDFKTTFRIENGAVRQDRLVLSSPQVDFRMSGTTSFEGRLNYELGVRPKGQASDTWARLGRLLDREGYLVVPLKGDVRHPSPKFPKLEHALGGAVEDLLKGGLNDLLKKKKKN